MALSSRHYSYRKLIRKIQKDGIFSTFSSSVETLYRREVFPSLFEILHNTNQISFLTETDLEKISRRKVVFGDKDIKSECKIYDVGSGYILPTTGIVLTEDFEFISQSIGSDHDLKTLNIEALAREDITGFLLTPRLVLPTKHIPTPTTIPRFACTLSPRYPNYFHWLAGTVPKLRYVERFEEETGEEVTLVLREGLPRWAKDTLTLLDYSPEKIIFTQDPVCSPDSLIIPPHPSINRLNDYRWIRRNILDGISEPPVSSSGERIYISRSRGIGRQVVNEDEVMETLSEYGFEKYHLEDRSLSQNAQLFAAADIVVSPHGAGLTDVIFSEDCTVVEFFGSQKTETYQILCDTLNLPYIRVDCQSDSTDMIVDTEKLAGIIQRID